VVTCVLLGLFLGTWVGEAGSVLPGGCGELVSLGKYTLNIDEEYYSLDIDADTGLRTKNVDGETYYIGRLMGEEGYKVVKKFPETNPTVFYEYDEAARGVPALYEMGGRGANS